MKHAFVEATLIVVLLFSTIVSGCHNDEPPFSPTGPSATDPSATGPAPLTYDEKLVGDWYLLGSTEGLEFRPGGILVPLTLDLDHKLQIDPYDQSTWYTPQQGVLIISSYYSVAGGYVGMSGAQITYVLARNDSILTLGPADGSSGNVTSYTRVAIGEAVR
jgi:hypothetical protein